MTTCLDRISKLHAVTAAFALIALTNSACRTLVSDTANDMQASGEERAEDVQLTDGESDSNTETESDETNEFADEAIEEGFCKDDVYASYLRDRYLKEQRYQLKNQVGRGLRTTERRLEMDALFYARNRLVGPMVDYFGALPVVANPRVEYWMRFFRNQGKNEFLKWLVRAKTVHGVVTPLLRQEGLPEEIFFLGMIESGFSNTAYSRARATGPWQFMSGTAKLYGLKMTYWVDERRDPVKSTVAAARYLKDMYVRFGDWYLAMASYNAGPGKVSRAIRSARSRDFWRVANTQYLRAETKNYVPKVLAAAILASNAVGFGFDVKPNLDDLPPTASVELRRPIRLEELANKLDVPVALLSKWNPELIRNVTPPVDADKGEFYKLRLTEELANRFAEISAQLTYLEIKKVTMHVVKKGETLSGIAKKYAVNQQSIKVINPGMNPRSLSIGRQLAVPIPAVVQATSH